MLNISYQAPNQGRQAVSGSILRRVNGSNRSSAGTSAAQGSANALSVYPNPSAGAFTVEFTSTVAQAATLTLTDNLGREVKKQKVQVQAGFNQVPFEAQSAAEGIYQLSLVGANGERQVQKVSIKR